MEKVVQRSGRFPTPGNIHGQVDWDSEQPDRVEDIPADCKRVGLGGFKGPHPPKLFHD